MDKIRQKLFDLICKEEVLLFAGAGMSLYAGYPSGPQLARIIYEGLSIEHRKQIEFTTDLPKLTDDISTTNGIKNNYLIEILKREFQREPSNTKIHNLLATIPQFKTIITTNFDSLIEKTNNNIEVIRKSKDYPKVDPRKQSLFKIHGDLEEEDRIILTRTDYIKFFSDSHEETIFWNAVKERMSANHILFIGYSIEDPNIVNIIKKLISQLGKSRKEMFFVSPTITTSRLGFLKMNKIKYIKSTAELLLPEIFIHLKENFFPNILKGLGTTDTAIKFAKKNSLKISLSATDDKIHIFSQPGTKAEIKFKLYIA